MKTFLAVAATLGALTACSEQPTEAADSRSVQAQNSAMEIEDYAAMDRPTFIASMEKKLATVSDELTTLEAKVAEAGIEVKNRLKPTLEALPMKREALEKRFSEFKDSVAVAATELRKDIVDSCLELQAMIKEALEKVS